MLLKLTTRVRDVAEFGNTWVVELDNFASKQLWAFHLDYRQYVLYTK